MDVSWRCQLRRCRRLAIDDDGVIDVDRVVRSVGVDGRAAARCRPPCGRIDWRDELWLDRSGGPKGGIVEDRQILRYGPIGRRIETFALPKTSLAMGIRHDDAAIDGERMISSWNGSRTFARWAGRDFNEGRWGMAISSVIGPV